MMEIKIAGVLLIIAAGTSIGYIFGENAKKQLYLLESLRRCLVIFRGEVQYSGTPLCQIFELLSQYSMEMWSEFFGYAAADMQQLGDNISFGQMWEEVLEKTGLGRYFLGTDKVEFIRFGNELGSYDKGSQLGHIDIYIEKISNRIREIESALNERVRLCRILGVACGIFITILII